MITDTDFITLIEKHRDEFYRFVRRTLWNESNADDVFSEALLASYKGRDAFTEGTNFRAWMFKILLNKCYVANRDTSRNSISVDSVEEWIHAEDEPGYAKMLGEPDWFVDEIEDELLTAMDKLRTVEKACLVLLTFEKYSYKEISSILEIPVGTVITHLSRGRSRLRKTLLGYARAKGIIEEGTDSNRTKNKAASAIRRSS